ncbi:hypothetical protein BCR44DRAFT_1423169 [Catenaria anguillulae PL171]|uniref:Uncharacterized protein n=1 Tax=Catenaria anguillulae PL171 TaxID=765915 RepID=A0A1Y2I4F0_9FUNG|nr:hypothetical protein BCR44DRAFT_1423169 [Catenaria anguillulae PL171]
MMIWMNWTVSSMQLWVVVSRRRRRRVMLMAVKRTLSCFWILRPKQGAAHARQVRYNPIGAIGNWP